MEQRPLTPAFFDKRGVSLKRTDLARTALRLGLRNIARVLWYRLLKRAGVYRRLMPMRAWDSPVVCAPPLDVAPAAPGLCDAATVVGRAERLLCGKLTYFSIHDFEVGAPPDWFLNPFTGKRFGSPGAHWGDLPDFDPAFGDIKILWEPSRFGWATIIARAARVSGDRRYTEALAQWAGDWMRHNAPNTGPNWKCGQEASIRLVNVLLSFWIAQGRLSKANGLEDFIATHCRRIAWTTSYAIGQDNNHGTSEAAGLFLGGSWLERHASNPHLRRRGRRWARKGRRMLERRVTRLVHADGSFSQHSTTYHRVLLDTLSVAEAWRRAQGALPFSPAFYRRAEAATRWLAAMVDPQTGDAPNLGANDGAYPYDLGGGTGYRDFRPCVQLAAAFFCDAPALPAGPWDEPKVWLQAPEPAGAPWQSALGPKVFEQGGYAVLRVGGQGGARVMVRAPTADFRPTHADALHLDLWLGGINLLRDGGSYSYADEPEIGDALSDVRGHNTVQFDGRDQMPRLGRFLYGRWIRVHAEAAIAQEGEGLTWQGAYVHYAGCRHLRKVFLSKARLVVTDELSGFCERAVVHWRLGPGKWIQRGTGCSSALAKLTVHSDVAVDRVEMIGGVESRHYLEKTPLLVFELEVSRAPAVLVTTVSFSPSNNCRQGA